MSTIQRVLAPIDFSNQSELAIREAGEIARSLGAELFIMHSLDLPTYAVESGLGMVAPTMGAEIAPEVETRIRDVAAGIVDPAVKITTIVKEGRSHVEINEFARDAGIDLIVMPTHGRTGIPHLLLGSTAERVVREAPCSVLVVRDGVARHEPARILVPVDLDDSPEGTLDVLHQLVPEDQADVTLLHAVDRPYTVELGMGNIAPETLSAIRAEAESQVATMVPPQARRLTREGVPHLVITEYIEEAGIELVAMPTHGRTGISHLFLGSTAERVVRGAKCHVLIVRNREDAAA